MVDERTGKKILFAKDAVIGKPYLVAGMYHRMVVKKVNGNPEEKYVSSVRVEDETEPFREVMVSGETELIEYEEKLHITPPPKVVTTASRKGDTSMPQQKNPRSKVIDKMLAETKAGATPDWEAIATAVIAAGSAPEGKRKSVISQAKVRYKWYTDEGKKNPVTEPKVKKGGKKEEKAPA